MHGPNTPEHHRPIPAADAPHDLITHCDRIDYQYSAIVQSYGTLIVLEATSLTVVQVSANLADITGVGTDAALGGRLEGVLDALSAERALGGLMPVGGVRVVAGLASVSGRSLIGRCQRVRAGGTYDGCDDLVLIDLVLIELEPSRTPSDLDATRLWQGLDAFSDTVTASASVADTAAGIASGLRELVGCDRCMVYRFDHEWNGEVIAESRSGVLEDSFLGLHFPATDIPKSARAMFMACRVRMTADQHEDHRPLVPRKNPVTGADLDLTPVRCRAAAGPCREYYNNLGVRSTMVMPIVIGGRLWGLFSCHHGSARRASALTDAPLSIARRIGESAIERSILLDQAAAGRRAADLHAVMAGCKPTDPSWIERLGEQVTGFRRLIGGDGFVLRIAGVTHRDGLTPDAEGVERLFGALIPAAAGEVLATNRLAADHPGLADLSPVACGALVVPMPMHPGDGAIWLRREQPEAVDWAGDPNEGVRWDEAGRPVLTPRASFALWRISTASTARAWSDFERYVANSAAANLGLMLLSWHTAEASRSKTEFLANMSHEIRTPMTAILGFVGVMAERETDPTRLSHLETIGRNARHLLTILNDILDLSKIDAGRLAFEIAPTDIGALLNECRELVGPLAEAKGLTLAVERGPGACDASPINTDPVRLRQVVLNLVGNAIKFTRAGTVTMGVDALGPGGSRRVWVRDTGIGMTPEQSRRVLEPFEQADSSTTRVYGGTGLGLTICSRLVARLGGDFAIESEPGVGTTVSFRVEHASGAIDTADRDPAAEASARPDAAAAGRGPGAGSGAGSVVGSGAAAAGPGADRKSDAPLRGVRVLLAEDGPDNQKLITHYLTRAGAVVDLAVNGREAVDRATDAAVAGRAYRVVLMDMQMPVMDGYEAARVLRDRGVTTPVIALTAHTMAGDREKCLLAGCSDFQAKPIVPAELIGCCVRWLGCSHAAA